MQQESHRNAKPVPLYTKIGWIAAWVVMSVLILMILRNCMTSVKYGSQTEIGTVDSYYQLGLKEGQLGKDFFLPGDVMNNPVLRKSYTKGYREGMDARKLPEK
nr:hypothetical protein [Desulfobulbaceae bacterium]